MKLATKKLAGFHEAVELLRSKKITPTTPRVRLACLIMAKPQHLTAEEIYQRLNNGSQKISRASVYNNLHLFVKVGLLCTLHVNPYLTIYDTNLEPHHHLIDTQTGEIFDIDINTAIPPVGTNFFWGEHTYYIENSHTVLLGRRT